LTKQITQVLEESRKEYFAMHDVHVELLDAQVLQGELHFLQKLPSK
jgi:hypothetical protein